LNNKQTNNSTSLNNSSAAIMANRGGGAGLVGSGTTDAGDEGPAENERDDGVTANSGTATATAGITQAATTEASSAAAPTVATATTTAAAPVVLNLYQKIAVLRTGDDTLTYEDAQGRWKSVKVRELGDIIHKATPLEQKHAAAKHDIPVPQINSVSTYKRDVPDNYDLPNSYVRSQRVQLEDWLRRVDYMADAEDEQWLEKKVEWNAQISSYQQHALHNHPSSAVFSLEMLEVMMDALEKATGFETIVTFGQAESLLLQKLPVLHQLFPTKRQKQQNPATQQPTRAPATSTSVTLKQVLRDVYQYWVDKRSKLKRPLLRRFWPVTSTDDTNPHLVFRPREKEKYKLRKKRQNDLDAYMKLKQLRADFDNLRAIAELVKRREELSQLQLRCHIQVFRERLRDMTDTSIPLVRDCSSLQHPRFSFGRSSERSVQERSGFDVILSSSLDVPTHFDTMGRKAKRVRADETDLSSSSSRLSPAPNARDLAPGGAGINDPTSTSAAVANVAGRNYGEPAPLFLHPLSTRETFATSWEGAVPHLPTYHNTHASPVYCFRHRPRVGRGGRVCVDRLPVEPPPDGNFYFRAGQPLPMPEKRRLLDLLPRPLNHAHVSQRIQELVLRDETVGDEQENDGDEIVVKVDDWLETDDPLWGDERFAIGPI
jgi:enhancer of polycomb-like protein